MAQDQTNEKDQVLIARNNETGETGAVKGLKQDGTPDMAPSKSAKLSDLVVFNIHKNPLEAFLSNFVRQCKNPSMFSFFKVDADNVNSVGQVVEDALKDPEANKAMLSEAKVEVKATNRNSHAIDESRIDWQGLKDRWGIDRETLEKSGDLKEMLYNRKSKIVTVTPTFAGEKFPIDARLSFRTDPDGSVKLVPHFIHREARLDQDFMGYKFSKDEKAVLRETGNLGKVVELTGRNGEKVPSYVSIDRYTNELVSVPVKDVFVRNTVGQTKLTDAEVAQLKQGMALPPKEITDKNGKTYNVVLQVSADRKGVEFVPDSGRRHEQREQQTQGQKPSSWITADGRIKPLSKWCKVPMTQQQQADYAAGKVVELTNIPDKNGKLNTVYLQFNPEKQRPTTSLNDPRVTVAEESRTQKAVNTDGLTNEATKHVAEPIQKYQTAPKNEAQQQQQRKPKGPKM